MHRLRSLAFATAALTALASPAMAQGVNMNGQVQAGTPGSPAISSTVDPAHGQYYGSNRVGISGHVESGVPASGDVPALSSCGTGALTAGSTDSAGEFTTTGGTGCTLTFGTAYTAAPSCSVTEETVTTATRTTTVTAASIVIASGGSGSKYSYVCLAKSGG